MTDNAQRTLERIAERVPVPEPAFDRLLHRRDRKQRNRRISAAVVALALTLLSLTALMRAFGHAPTPAAQPTPMPIDTDRLAYAVHGDIYVADANGRNRVRIADGVAGPGGPGECGTYWGEGPIWSPDGRYLSFRGSVAHGGSCHGTVNIANPDRGVVTSFPVGMGWLTSWSPDSSRVAVWVHLGKTIGIFGLDGVRQALLTLPPDLMAPGDFDPVWSRDGASLLLPYGVVLPIDGSAPRQLPRTDPRAELPFQFAYSPDGARIAYVSRDAPDALTIADGSHQARVLVNDAVWYPVWSPTGDRIAVATTSSNEVDLVDVASGTVTTLTRMGSDGELHILGFSSDGDRVLFSQLAYTSDGANAIWVVGTDGTGLHRLVDGTYWGGWQPRMSA